MGEFAVGQGVTRFEDPRLLRGGGRYVDDIVLPRMAIRLRPAFSSCPCENPLDRYDAGERCARCPARPDRRGLEKLRLGRPAGARRTEAPRRQRDVSLSLSGTGAGSRALGRRLRCLRRRGNLRTGGRCRRADRGGLRAAAVRYLDRGRRGAAARRACGTIARTTSASFISPATRRRRTQPSRAPIMSCAIVS